MYSGNTLTLIRENTHTTYSCNEMCKVKVSKKDFYIQKNVVKILWISRWNTQKSHSSLTNVWAFAYPFELVNIQDLHHFMERSFLSDISISGISKYPAACREQGRSQIQWAFSRSLSLHRYLLCRKNPARFNLSVKQTSKLFHCSV